MPEKNPKKEFYTYIFILLAGTGLTVLAIKEYNSTNQLLSGGIKTQATITEIIVQREKNKNLERSSEERNHIPVFEFTDQSGNVLKAKGEETNSPTFVVGGKVEIIYDPANPTQVRTTNFFGIHGRTLIFALLAVSSFVASVWFFFIKKKHPKTNS